MRYLAVLLLAGCATTVSAALIFADPIYTDGNMPTTEKLKQLQRASKEATAYCANQGRRWSWFARSAATGPRSI